MIEEEAVQAIDDAISDWRLNDENWTDVLAKIKVIVNDLATSEYERGNADGRYEESRASSSLGFFD